MHEVLDSKDLQLVPVASPENVADILTKKLLKPQGYISYLTETSDELLIFSPLIPLEPSSLRS